MMNSEALLAVSNGTDSAESIYIGYIGLLVPSSFITFTTPIGLNILFSYSELQLHNSKSKVYFVPSLPFSQ